MVVVLLSVIIILLGCMLIFIGMITVMVIGLLMMDRWLGI